MSAGFYELATYYFNEGDGANGIKSLETTYGPPQMPYHLMYYSNGAISTLTGDEKRKAGRQAGGRSD